MTTTKTNKVLIAVIVIMSLAVIGLGVALFMNNSMLSGHASSLENVYQRSFYQLVDNINSIEVEVSKLMVTNDSKGQQTSLNTIKQQTADAQNNLSMLPLKSNVISTTTKFVNQLNGYCTSLLNYSNARLTTDNYETIEKIYDCVAMIKYELNNISYKINQGYNIVDNLDSKIDVDGFGENFEQINNDSIEYPSMIYDGPFSDSVLNQEIKGLGSDNCNKEQAQEYVTEIYKDKNVTAINYMGQTKGKFTTFDFKITFQDSRMFFVQITERGKFLLTISGQSNVNNEKFSKDDCIQKAVNFAKSLKLDKLNCVWSASAKGITYVNLAPIINNAIIYPDLIKVKVDMQTGDIVGWEASSYAYNHIERTINTATLTQDKAKELVSTNLKINSVKLCVIPLEYAGESLAYEVMGEYNGFTYYVYIDANSGEQIKVMRVIETSEGELLL